MTTALLAVLLALPAAADDWNARVSEVTGSVLIYSEGSDEGLPAEAGTPLEDGDRVETGDDGRAELALEPDSVMELGSGSSFTVGSTKESDSWFSLSLGSLMAKVKSLAKTPRRRFSIRTPTSVCAVRGTEFGMEVGDDGETSVGVFDEGKLAVTASGGEEQMITAKQEVTVGPGEREFKVRGLERLERRRGRIGHLRERRQVLAKGWKNISPERRKEMRQKWQHGMREKLKNMPPGQREKMMKGFQDRRQKMEGRREGLREKFKGKRQEKREERREGLGEDQRRKGPGKNGPGGGQRRDPPRRGGGRKR